VPVKTDPIASLTAWPVDVAIGGKVYVVPPLPAAQWMILLLDEFGSFDTVIEVLSVTDRAEIEQGVIDGTVDDKDMEQAFRDVVEVAAGRPWWVVLNYLNLIQGFWSRFHGRILLSGLDPERVSFGAYLDAAHYSFIEGRDEQGIQKIINFLETPPPGYEIELDQETESETFLAMMNQQR
jgi:hypothetical protein